MSSIIKKAQSQMNAKGIDVGVADGIWGPKTEAGWAKYAPTLGEPWRQLTSEFKDGVAKIASGLRMPKEGREWLLACMSWETGGTFSPSITNGAGSGACVTRNVLPITRRCGITPVKDLRLDDQILAFDPESGDTRFSPVQAITSFTGKHLYSHRINDNQDRGFSSTASHRWLIDGQEQISDELPSDVFLPIIGIHEEDGSLPGGDACNDTLLVILLAILFGRVTDDRQLCLTITSRNSKAFTDQVDMSLAMSGMLDYVQIEPNAVEYYIRKDLTQTYYELANGIMRRDVASYLMYPLSRMLSAAGTSVLYDVSPQALGTLNLIQLFSDTRLIITQHQSNAIHIVTNESHRKVRDELVTELSNQSDASVWCPTVAEGYWIGMVNGEFPIVTGNSGLIQFMPSTAVSLGTTTAALRKMTQMEQLVYVEKYFAHNRGRLQNLGDVYMAILWPAGIGKPDSYVLWDKNGMPKTFSQNAGLDLNKDSRVTRAECLVKIREHLLAGYGIK